MTDYNIAQVKIEGGVVSPDEMCWECDCPKCLKKLERQTEAYEKYLREVENTTKGNQDAN